MAYYDNSNYRSEWEIKEHIIRGKMAEVGYYNMCKAIGIKNITTPDLKNHKNGDDGGKDFIVNNTSIDIKSLTDCLATKNYFKVILNPSMRANAYVLCRINTVLGYVIYEEAITAEQIKRENLLIEDKNSKIGKLYWYVNISNLKELNETFV